jgi:exopolysaccharide biosynthesis polyprenyl glycosylphosphotransferase
VRNPEPTSMTSDRRPPEREVRDEIIDLTDVEGAPDDLVVAGPPVVATSKSALRHYRLISLALVPIDISCLVVALLAAHAIRFGFLPATDYLVGTAVATALWVGVFYALGLYSPQHLSRVEEFRRTSSAVVIGIVLVILLTFWLEVYLSRSWMAYALLIALTLELVSRGIVRYYVDRLQDSRSLMQRTLILGSGERATELMDELDRRGSGYLPLGYIDVANPLIASPEASPAERVETMRTTFRGYDLDCVFVASSAIGVGQMVALTQAARLEGIVVRVYTHLPGILPSRLTVQHVGRDGVSLTLKPAGLSAGQRAVKRAMDLILSTLGVIVVSPILLGVAIAIRATSSGPVMFRQERVTEGNRTFWMYKFRTMTDDPARRSTVHHLDATAPFYKPRDDPRLTPVGRWLRRWSLDELPQLFNVFRGDMSLVGPRPLPAEQVSANMELLGPRHEVRSGITGWWQVQGRSTVRPEEAIRLDQFYIENWSPALDLYILLRTIGTLVKRQGAF